MNETTLIRIHKDTDKKVKTLADKMSTPIQRVTKGQAIDKVVTKELKKGKK